eukprot:TRINITY_DN3023_c0_g2_i2.p1 TRINITY_DN3023_c0_g2~~TRINITY_DN3023_c0_g2_i2.p1  ORF type:complete len:167 (-),score=24.60 TRINITY_DN3023_c0_g2_i2:394-861(-)
MEKISRSIGKKRKRDEDLEAENHQTDETPSLENNLTFSDTMIALRIMHAQFPQIEKVTIQPFVLRSQLYSSVSDRTQVDRELESLKEEKVLRLFKLNSGQDDHAIMFVDDYLKQMEFAVKRMKPRNEDDFVVFDWFKSYVIVSKLDTSIGHQELF